MSSEGKEQPTFSAEDFFRIQPPPPHLQEHLDAVKSFVERNVSQGRRVVLVTSGGTTVPLEHNVVRFLDNFSAGTRGSASAEHFLRTGKYAVIFLHRQHSLQPFSRHYSHSTNPFLDLLEVVDGAGHDAVAPLVAHPPKLKGGMLFPPVPAVGRAGRELSRSNSVEESHTAEEEAWTGEGKTTIQIPPPHLGPMLSLVRSYKLVKSMRILHSIAFTTVDEYFFFLRGVSRVMGIAKDAEGKALGRRGMYYLAAAVSDFYIPRQRMVSPHLQF
ncbi:phosphopantothenate---cysteine ligase (ATP), partial [Phenoliferia sp. Uapishka_3]